VGAHARLELVARADLAAVGFHEACVHGEMLRASRSPPRDPAQQPAVRLKQHRNRLLTRCSREFLWYIEDQAFFRSYDSAPCPPLPPLFRQQVVFLYQSSYVSPIEGGEEPNHTTTRKPGLYKSFYTPCGAVSREYVPFLLAPLINHALLYRVSWFKNTFLQSSTYAIKKILISRDLTVQIHGTSILTFFWQNGASQTGDRCKTSRTHL
jgi:hypothetical protein